MSSTEATATERSPLLKKNYTTIEDDREGSITIITSSDDESIRKSPNTDEILAKRLNGSPLWVVLVG
ncbi:hypothetical protein G6F68_021473 [Rhizopus microsporus]|jgi:hypothetical protein|nr:hypothetical protein G6F68_021473 [Rhizopus microsporus]